MIYSMTAFSKAQNQNQDIRITWEIKSVNHRYLETHFKLPEGFKELEIPLTKLIQKHLSRGKIDCTLRYQLFESETANSLNINQDLITRYLEQIQQLGLNTETIDASQLLKLPEVIRFQAVDLSNYRDLIIEQFELALTDLKVMRANEGQRLGAMIVERLEGIKNILIDVEKAVPDIKEKLKTKLLKQLEDIDISFNPERFEQELVYYAQRMDVDEELDRIHSHIKEVEDLLNAKKPIGRRLDFLMQEFNREANTLGSKSAGIIMSQSSIELKVLIEQMREQIQNIE